MLIDKFKRKAKEATTVNAVLLTVALASTASTVFLSAKIASQHERIVLTPPHVHERMEVAWNSASAEYYKSFGLYVAGLVGNITPKNVDFITDVLSGFLHSSIYADVRTKLKAMSEDPVFRDSGAYSYFMPEQIIYEPDTSKVFVVGNVMLGTAARQPRPEAIVYELMIRMENGRPIVYGLQSYPGNEPRTVEWKKNHPEFNAQQVNQGTAR
jgi:conjugal transfer pilus assembly protein TraE